MTKAVAGLFFFLSLSACVGTSTSSPAPPSQQVLAESESTTPRPANASNYERDLIYPRETENFVFDGLVQYDDPFYGTAVSYIDKRDYPDIITVFFYPIPATTWRDQNFIFNNEIDSFILELDRTVEVGAYQFHGEGSRSDYTVKHQDRIYLGKKVHFEFANKQGLVFNADAYFFIQKDKFIKIRTSSRKDFTPDWNGDLIVDELLPEFVVPDESEFMRELRDQYRR